MISFFELLASILSLLPTSFIVGLFVDFVLELTPIIEYIHYVNYFIPFYLFLPVISGWAVSMLLVVIVYRIFESSGDL